MSMNMNSPIWSRTLSSFPLSVGTGLALESIFTPTQDRIDSEREIPEQIVIKNYDEFWINIYTLFRNITSSMSVEQVTSVTASDVLDALNSEMDVIIGLLQNEANGLVIPRFYLSEYSNLDKKYPLAIIRGDTTIGQKNYRKLYTETVKLLIKQGLAERGILVFKDNIEPKKAYPKAIILTHVVHDLLKYAKFSKLDLLESHTGVLKTNNKFYTKYLNGKELFPLPFNKLLLQVFGDKETFRPQSSEMKKTLIELAKENKWTPATTREKIITNIGSMKNHYLSEIFKKML